MAFDAGFLGHMNDPRANRLLFIELNGRNPDIATTEEDVWNVGGEETPLSSAGAKLYASCEDNVNGVGQVIMAFGLNDNFDITVGFATLTGNTQAEFFLADGGEILWTALARGHQVSAAPDPVGDVWIAETDTVTLGVPQTASKIHGKIEYTNAAQTVEKAEFIVPRGYQGWILNFEAGMLQPTGSSRSAEVFIEIEDLAVEATVGSPLWTPARRIHTHSLRSDAQVSDQIEFAVPLLLPELTRVHVRAVASATSEVRATVGGIAQPINLS